LRAYFSLGGKVSDHAVIDADFGTKLLFTGVNVAQVPQKRAQRLWQSLQRIDAAALSA
jgi:hypothetical protein